MKTVSVLLLLGVACISVTACRQPKESVAAKDAGGLVASFSGYSNWVATNKDGLRAFAISLRAQSELNKILFSKDRSYCTAILSNGYVVSGAYDWDEPNTSFAGPVAPLADLLREKGLWGFTIDRDDMVVHLYLAPDLYIADIPRASHDQMKRYANWASEGPDYRGDRCVVIDSHLFFCTERR